MIVLQIEFAIAPAQMVAFQTMYETQYAPALRRQAGYLNSRLLQLFPSEVAGEIEAQPTEYNFQMELCFDSEANRRRWATSADHDQLWPLAKSMALKVAWRGYDVAAIDERTNSL